MYEPFLCNCSGAAGPRGHGAQFPIQFVALGRRRRPTSAEIFRDFLPIERLGGGRGPRRTSETDGRYETKGERWALYIEYVGYGGHVSG